MVSASINDDDARCTSERAQVRAYVAQSGLDKGIAFSRDPSHLQ